MWKNALSVVVAVVIGLTVDRCTDGWFASPPNVDAIHAENDLHARERSSALPAGFTTPNSFAALIASLEALTGSDSIAFVGERDGGTPVPSRGVGFLAKSDTFAKALADTMTRLVQPKGLSVFAYASGAGLGPWYVVAMPTPEPYEAIEVVGTNGNSRPRTNEIIQWLRKLQVEQPFIVTHVGRDKFGGRFLTPLKDAGALAARFNDFCPDIVRQGARSVRNLEIEMRESRFLFCWWD
jgi:hypothetical protein